MFSPQPGQQQKPIRANAALKARSANDARTGRKRPRSYARKGCAVTLHLQAADTEPSLRPHLARHLRQIAAAAGVRDGAIAVAVVDDREMARLHGRFLGEKSTTDVLTFDQSAKPQAAGAAVEGDIVVCVDEARRQARRRGHEVREELLLYAVHGLLHLLGYDDHDPADARAMHRREDELLTEAGLGPIFAGSKTR